MGLDGATGVFRGGTGVAHAADKHVSLCSKAAARAPGGRSGTSHGQPSGQARRQTGQPADKEQPRAV